MRSKRSGSSHRARDDLGGQRRRRPRVHHVGVGSEPTGLVALAGGEAVGRVARGIDREPLLARDHRLVQHRLAARVQAVPDRDGDTEEALAAHEPVGVQTLDPRVVALLHVRRVPHELLAAREEHRPQVGVASAVAEVPLPRRHDLERAPPALVELHRVRDRLRFPDELAGVGEQLDDPRLCLLHRLARELRVAVGRGGIDAAPPLGRRRQHPPVATEHVAHRQLQLAPPHDVGGVAEGADHRDAGALVRIRERMGDHRDRHAEQRSAHRVPEAVGVSGVVGVGDQRDARRQQLGTRRLDHEVGLPVGAVEREPVVRARHLAVLELGLRDRGAVVDVPEGGRLRRVGLAAGQHAEERALRRPARDLTDGRVRHLPVDRQAEATPQLLELLLVLDHERVAQLDEPLPRDGDLPIAGLLRRGEVLLDRQRRIAAHAVVVLHPPLGREAVVVPAHRVEDLVAEHAPLPGQHVGLGVAEHGPHVEGAAHGGRWRVDREDLFARPGAVERVGAVRLPVRTPLVLEPVERRLVRDGHPGILGSRDSEEPKARISGAFARKRDVSTHIGSPDRATRAGA